MSHGASLHRPGLSLSTHETLTRDESQPARSDATAAWEAQQERYEREAAARAERKAAERRAREAEQERVMQEKLEKARRKEAERARAAGGKTKRPKFNFELVSVASPE